jgi:hypothetical protein
MMRRGILDPIVSSAIAALLSGGCSATSDPGERTAAVASRLAVADLHTTGVDDGGVPLPIAAIDASSAPASIDPHYTLSSNDPMFPGPSAYAAFHNGWTTNTAGSTWISIQPSTQGGANLTYSYTTHFTLNADPATAAISGQWACDDQCALKLNGNLVAQYAHPAYSALAAFSVAPGGPFVLGTNTLIFEVTNITGATGLQVANLTATATCDADSQCQSWQFCDTGSGGCVAKLANGVPIPVVGGHTPPITGACTPGAGLAVCSSGVCDTVDNMCGFADGDGMCTPVTASTVCRSGSCSTNGTCEPGAGCNVDADCAATQGWCFETRHFCKAKAPNGAPVPTDPAHANPSLDGRCTGPAAMLACGSGVCSMSNNLCGYASGEGQCTPSTATTVCQSNTCSMNGACEPAGGCNIDLDCVSPAMPTCDTSAHVCVALPDAGADAGDDGGNDSGADSGPLDSGLDAGDDASDASPIADGGSADDGGGDASALDTAGGMDAGRPTVDSGADSGVPATDAGADAPPAGSGNGPQSSGCGCHTAGGSPALPSEVGGRADSTPALPPFESVVAGLLLGCAILRRRSGSRDRGIVPR